MAVVYGLIDPRTSELRYVGQTVNLKWRVRHHWKPISLAGQTHSARWLRGLRDAGFRPTVVTIEEVPPDQIDVVERYWIAVFRSVGCPLTNLQDGGQFGAARPKGWHHTDGARAKIRAARALQPHPRLGTKHSPETIQLYREQRRGKPKSEAFRRALSIYMTGRKRGPYKRRAEIGAQ